MSNIFDPQTQQDLVDLRSMDDDYAPGKEVTEDIKLPGLESLHQMPKDKAAMFFVNVLKCRPCITRIEYKVGKPYITISYLVP